MYERTSRAFPTALSLIIEEDPTRHSRVFVDCARKLKFKITSCHTGAYKETLSYVVLINTINKVENPQPVQALGGPWELVLRKFRNFINMWNIKTLKSFLVTYENFT